MLYIFACRLDTRECVFLFLYAIIMNFMGMDYGLYSQLTFHVLI